MKVLHIITGLNTGGAETMLAKLLAALGTGGGPDAEVISLTAPGPIAARIEALGIPVRSPMMPSGPGALFRLYPLARMIRASRPDIVQCWMYHANLMGGIATRLAGAPPVIWGLRQSTLDPARSKRTTIMIARLGARLSRLADVIACVSRSARDVHAAMGYDAARMVVIPNGFDPDTFRPDAAARASVRAEIGIAEETPLVGLIARVDPQKDHATFIRAAAHVVESGAEAHFLLAGDGTDADNAELAGLIAAAGLNGRMHLLGARDDVPRLTAALDIAVSSSAFGEGFSNTLGEALCAGVPVVTTDIGDSARIAGDEGRVVPPGDADALGRAIGELIAAGPEARARLGAAARARMARDYGIEAIARRWTELYARLAPGAPESA